LYTLVFVQPTALPLSYPGLDGASSTCEDWHIIAVNRYDVNAMARKLSSLTLCYK